MIRIQYHRYGDADQMRLELFELPEPTGQQVVVRMRAASLNPMDIKMRRGVMKMMTGRRFPRPMGSDLSGIVESVGADVSRVKVGDEVFGTAPMWASGAFAERVLTEEKLLVPKPESISFELASSLPTVGIAAELALVESAKLRAGQQLFVHGCLGGVGRAAVQIAQSIGAKVTGSCRAESMNQARNLGLDTVVDFNALDLAEMRGRFDVVFDTVSALSLRDGRALLRPKGLYVDTNFNIGKLLKGLLLGRYKLVAAMPSPDRLQRIADLAAKGILAPSIERRVDLSESISAIRDFETGGRHTGKLVIVSGA